MGFEVVLAATCQGAIGKNGKLPWNLPADLQWFKRITSSGNKKNACIMGRLTFESVDCKPLPNRLNVIVTSRPLAQSYSTDDVQTAPSFDEALEIAQSQVPGKVYVIGGATLYKLAFAHEDCDCIWWTRVTGPKTLDSTATTFVPVPVVSDEVFAPVYIGKTRFKANSTITYDFTQYVRRSRLDASSPPNEKGAERAVETKREASHPSKAVPHELFEFETALDKTGSHEARETVRAAPTVQWRLHEEFQYLDLVAEVINKGVISPNRTGIPARSVFGRQMRFDLGGGVFPLLTTKKTFWKGVLEELIWFVKGNTDGKLLSAKGVHIWDGNGSREFLDNLGFTHREVGDLGPIYGFQWRHFGAEYKDCHADYTGQGVDQLAECIRQLREDPSNRRILLSAWNPTALPLMALPPCHMFCQFYTDGTNRLSCSMYQRSADLGLGVPFNIASYALLTRVIAHLSGLEPGEFVHFIGNAHVYENHVEPLKQQLSRVPLPFPHVKIDPALTDIDMLDASHVKLIGYVSLDKVQMEMAV